MVQYFLWLDRSQSLGLLLEKLSDSPRAFRIKRTQKWESIDWERMRLWTYGARASALRWQSVRNIMKCRHKQIYRKLVMKRNQGSEDLDSEKKPLLQSLHLTNVFGISSLKGETTAYLLSMYVMLFITSHIVKKQRTRVVYISERRKWRSRPYLNRICSIGLYLCILDF